MPLRTSPSRSAPPAAVPASDLRGEDHFRTLARLVEARVGIRLPPARKAMVEGRLRRRARRLDLPSLRHDGAPRAPAPCAPAPLKVWSAAASSGAEAYRLAMVLHGALDEASRVVCGMPRAAAERGAVATVASLDKIGPRLGQVRGGAA